MSEEQQTQEIEDRGDSVTDVEEVSESEPEVQSETPSQSEKPQEIASEKPRAEHVPRARFDEVNDRLREERQARMDMEARLRALEAPKPPPFDAKATERAYLDAIAEGDREKASEHWAQIRAHERRQQEAELSSKVRAELDQHRAQIALETAAEALVEKYPFLDPARPDANADAIAEVVEWRDYYIVAKKMVPHQALRQAVNRVAPGYAKEAAAGIAGQTAEQRVQAQRAANAKAAAAQPPNTAGVGIGERANRSQKVDVMKMTEAEFDALPKSERARLRGDAMA